MTSQHSGSILKTWEHMTPEELRIAFNNELHCGAEAAAEKIASWVETSGVMRSLNSDHLNIPYDSGDRNKWDIYPSKSNPYAPCLVYIHGGYFKWGSKEAYACVVDGVLAHGWSAALPGYTLAPDATLTQIVAELNRALDLLPQLLLARGISGPIVLSGWSAGGYLTAVLLKHPSVAAGVALSGVYNLYPMRASPHVNDKIQLSNQECASLSPSLLPQTVDKPLHIVYGSAELPVFMESAYELHQLRSTAHLPGSLIPVAGADHFVVLDQLRDPRSLLTRSIVHATLP
jgi:acetyl esterase/lipase